MSISFPQWLGKRFRHASRRRRSFSLFPCAIQTLESRQLLSSATSDITQLNDEFDDASTLQNWFRVEQTEGWNSQQLEVWDINNIRAGEMTMIPETSVWYQDWRGPMAYKEVTGDFVMTTSVRITDRDSVGGSDADNVPGDGQFSLAGPMVRTPRNIINPATDWQPGTMQDDGTNQGENYIFLSLGHATDGGFSFEAKSTRNSNSQLFLTPTAHNTARLRLARVGDVFVSLYQLPGGDWRVMQRIHRPDMPATLQVGLVTYTNWEKASQFDPFTHNNTTLQSGVADPNPGEPFDPDLDASFDYVRFVRPIVPNDLVGTDLVSEVTDLQLLSFLGNHAGSQPDPSHQTLLKVGVNLESNVDWSPAWPFRDAFQRARPWAARAYNPLTDSTTWQSFVGTGPELSVDSNGWVTDLKTWINSEGVTYEQRATTVVFAGDANQPAGIYRAEWRGDGVLVFPYIVDQGTMPDGTHYALVDIPAGAFFSMDVNTTNPADPIRDIHLWMPDYQGQSLVGSPFSGPGSASPFHPLFIERLDPFDTIRFMDWMNTNLTDVVTWDDRRTPSDMSQADGEDEYYHVSGVALEYEIALANQIDANPWFNMPHRADDNYVRQFATMVRDTLDPSLKVYVEWSNEVWNGLFEVNQWIQHELQQPANSGVGYFEFIGREIRRDFEIWSDVFAGQTDRLVRIVAGQQANPYILEQIMLNVGDQVDAVSVSAYAGIDSESALSFNGTSSPHDLIDFLETESIPWALDRLADHRRLADRFEDLLGKNLPLLTYESGSHIFGHLNPFPFTDALPVATEAMHHPRMYELYQEFLIGVQNVGVDVYNEFGFSSSGTPNYFGNYGLLHRQDQSLDELPQLRALYDFISSTTRDTTAPSIQSFVPVSPNVRSTAVGSVRITFNEAIDSSTFDPNVIEIRRNGAAIPRPNGLDLQATEVPTQFEIVGLDGIPLREGGYELTVSGSVARDLAGNLGTGSVVIPWTVANLGPIVESITPVTPDPRNSSVISLDVTFSEPVAVSTFNWQDIDLRLNGGPNRLTKSQTITHVAGNTYRINNLKSVTTGTGSFVMTIRGSGITDGEGNPGLGSQSVVWETDMSAPVTQVVDVDQSSAIWRITASGHDVGVSGLASMEFWVSVDGATAQKIGQFTAPAPDSNGDSRLELPFRPISDGVSHAYRFYSIGRDGFGRAESAPAGFGDVQLSAAIQPIVATTLDVNDGQAQRSKVTSITVTFNSSSVLSFMQSTLLDQSSKNDSFRLIRRALDGTGSSTVSLAGITTVSGSTLQLNFGAQGLKTDGLYELWFDADGNGSLESVRRFYRLKGDLNGDRVVNSTDEPILWSYMGQSEANHFADLTDDGLIDQRDRNRLVKLFGRGLGAGLQLDD